MRYFVAFIYLALSLITRLGLLITYIPALFGWLEPAMMTEQQKRLMENEWLAKHGVSHAHCPLGCEHPQPFFFQGEYICGRCAFIDNIKTPMDPCKCD